MRLEPERKQKRPAPRPLVLVGKGSLVSCAACMRARIASLTSYPRTDLVESVSLELRKKHREHGAKDVGFSLKAEDVPLVLFWHCWGGQP